ncbi:MAG: sulfotransferase [Cypionkella sp.]|uniref:sulfotransferase family protein n=1 Tax=Cypionkella sp. TaxID=2811411 RepID=UPI00261BBDDD|nr:sulfotransferase [Cypionkella sp.]MDB5661540.1 sulfotransferase [Cypionkella sp.]
MAKLKHRWSLGHNYMTGVTFGVWLRLLVQNRFRLSPAYWHRVAFITLASLANSGFAAWETLRHGRAITAVQITKPPLFILGHWRSGTTLLHDLLAQDTVQFQFANTYRVVNPLTFLTTERAVTRLLPGLVPDKRPMDNMPLKFTSPQEDEFAPLLMTGLSIYLGVSFPQTGANYAKYLSFRGVPRPEVERWKAAFLRFCKKLSLNDNRALLLKSPPHTARIRTILELFPDARFVHIHRDPYTVFQSQRHFFDTAGWYTYLQSPDLAAIDEGILQRHETMYDAYFEDIALIPAGHFTEVRFDALEADPVAQVAAIYQTLGLGGFTVFRPQLERYVATLAGYKKNSFLTLDPATRHLVAARWQRSFTVWGYPTEPQDER